MSLVLGRCDRRSVALTLRDSVCPGDARYIARAVALLGRRTVVRDD